jgi:hypothetical protein
MNRKAALREGDGDRRSNRGFTNAAFAHGHDQAMPTASQTIDQRRQRWRVRQGGQCLRCGWISDSLR